MTITIDSTTRQAIDDLLAVAQAGTGQSALAADFLLAWHNAGDNGGFDPTSLWALDDALIKSCLAVLTWIATNRAYPDEVGYGPQFKALWWQWRSQRVRPLPVSQTAPSDATKAQLDHLEQRLVSIGKTYQANGRSYHDDLEIAEIRNAAQAIGFDFAVEQARSGFDITCHPYTPGESV